MRRSVAFTALMFLAPFSACQAPSPEAGPLSEEDAVELEGIIEEYVESAMAGDLDTWSGLWTEDAVKMNPNSPALEGREAIREWMAGMPTLTEFTAPVVEIVGNGDLAYVRGTFSVTMVVAGVPEPMTEHGKYLSVFKQHPDGTWMMAIDIWNSDLPLPEPESAPEEP